VMSHFQLVRAFNELTLKLAIGGAALGTLTLYLPLLPKAQLGSVAIPIWV
jgi:hypothetical protein